MERVFWLFDGRPCLLETSLESKGKIRGVNKRRKALVVSMETSVDPNAFLSPSIRTFRLFPALVYLRRARARVSRSRKCVSRMCVRAQCQGSGGDGGVGVYSAAFRTTLEFPWSSSRQARIKIVDPRILFYSVLLKLPFFPFPLRIPFISSFYAF